MTEIQNDDSSQPLSESFVLDFEMRWRKAIADQVRANCTIDSAISQAGGDALIYAVCDWIESPPEWSAFTPPASPPKRYSILEHNSASREILRWHEPLRDGGPGWWEPVLKLTGSDWAVAVDTLETLLRGSN